MGTSSRRAECGTHAAFPAAVGSATAEGSGTDVRLGAGAPAQAVRHDRIADVIESTALRGIYEIEDEFDFSTDEAVSRGRPGPER
jgi:hypothetical protein